MKQCNHSNGWYCSVYVTFWIFKKRKLYFFCDDCKNALPYKKLINEDNKSK